MKKTPLYEQHVNLRGKIVEFAGWALPVQYSSILEEHEYVRNSAGLFDVSHMGEIIIEGPDAEKLIQKLITNNIANMEQGKIIYSPMCYPDGGTVDDILVYKMSNEEYFLVVNASNTDKDYQWMLDNAEGDAEITNVSSNYAQLALQGPKAMEILGRLANFNLEKIRPFRFEAKVDIAGFEALVSRTGYTGEDGFEIYIAPENAEKLWNKILDEGKEDRLAPAGLGARDTLRFEAGLPLYGQEISKEITPVEAGLSRFVKFDKGDFIGRSALLAQKENEPGRKLVGFEMIERGIPRSHYEVQSEGKSIGFVTSGNFSPTLKKNLGLALISQEYSDLGEVIEIVIRNKTLKATIIETPFYSRKRG
ncbi:MAG TPA: glycine cleavage system aminomethyltransferase GcvT [Clostridiales bacterium]|nr:glycine cleavage system aminomethyltransferase GcvT [Clostridiales bacterium]